MLSRIRNNKWTLRIIALLLIIISLIVIRNILEYKSQHGINQTRALYAQPKDSIDVLAIGSSHVHCGINTATLWETYGMAAYDLSAAEQPLWMTYYYLKEAYKTQSPKVVLLDVFAPARFKEDYQYHWIDESIYGMRPSKNKRDMLSVSVETEYLSKYRFDFLSYHNRYIDLNKEDMYNIFGGRNSKREFKGFTPGFNVIDQSEAFGGWEKNNDNHLSAKSEEYLKKIIELTKANGSVLYIIVVPYNMDPSDKVTYEQIQEIADEYGVFFADYNDYLDQMDIDKASDFNDHTHLNYWGSVKFSTFLGNQIKEKVDLSDRRGDKRYKSWDKNCEAVAELVLKASMQEKEGSSSGIASRDDLQQETAQGVSVSSENGQAATEANGLEQISSVDGEDKNENGLHNTERFEQNEPKTDSISDSNKSKISGEEKSNPNSTDGKANSGDGVEGDQENIDELIVDLDDIKTFDSPITMYVTSKVNVRKGPDTAFDRLATLMIGDEVIALGESKTKPWIEINYKDDIAFLHKDYLGLEKIDLQASQQIAEQEAAAQPVAPQPVAPQPVITNAAGVLFIGDSRTCQMRDASGGAGCGWICEYSTGYNWFVDTAIPQADPIIGKGTKVVICLGVNDPGNINNYANMVNQKAAEWNQRGAKVYYVSLNPVDHPYEDKTPNLDSFNATMPGLLSGVYWIDTASVVKQGGFVLEDGIHYDAAGNATIFSMIIKSLK